METSAVTSDLQELSYKYYPIANVSHFEFVVILLMLLKKDKNSTVTIILSWMSH